MVDAVGIETVRFIFLKPSVCDESQFYSHIYGRLTTPTLSRFLHLGAVLYGQVWADFGRTLCWPNPHPPSGGQATHCTDPYVITPD